jgi:hypothetical protein
MRMGDMEHSVLTGRVLKGYWEGCAFDGIGSSPDCTVARCTSTPPYIRKETSA